MTTLLEELGVRDIRDVQLRTSTVHPGNIVLEFIPDRDDAIIEKLGNPILRANRSGYDVVAGDALVMDRDIVHHAFTSPTGFTLIAVASVDATPSNVFQSVFECASISTGDDSIYGFMSRVGDNDELTEGSVGLAYNPNDYQGRQNDALAPIGTHVLSMRYDRTRPVAERLMCGFDGYMRDLITNAYQPEPPYAPSVDAGDIGFYADSRFTLGSTIRPPNPPGAVVPRVGYLAIWDVPLPINDWFAAMHETAILHPIS